MSFVINDVVQLSFEDPYISYVSGSGPDPALATYGSGSRLSQDKNVI